MPLHHISGRVSELRAPTSFISVFWSSKAPIVVELISHISSLVVELISHRSSLVVELISHKSSLVVELISHKSSLVVELISHRSSRLLIRYIHSQTIILIFCVHAFVYVTDSYTCILANSASGYLRFSKYVMARRG